MAMMQVPEVLDPSELDQPHSERIRQRPVDLDKKLPFVILADKDAEADDLENAQARRHFYRKATAEERAAIPIPRYTIVPTDDDPKEHFRRTPGYMHWIDKSLEDLMERVEYEADDADTAFIETLRLGHSLTPAELDEDKFELILDRLEKKAFQRSNKKILEKSDANPQQSGDDVPCAVCNDRDYEPKNLIVFCDGCNVAVHQDCYGLKKIPDGQWYCNRCKAGEQNAQCDLCPTETGAFKPTDTGGWCHVSCAIWMPGVHIDDVNKMEPVSGVKTVNPERFNLVCSVCGQKHGACIQCKYGSCVAAFHVTCAQSSGLYMNIQEGQKDVLYTAYCKKHSDLKYEQDMCEKVRNGTFIAEELGAAKLAKISQKANIKFSEAVMEDIFKYWVKKRNANGGRPLLGRLQQFADEKAASNLPISSSLKAHLSSNQSFMQLVALRRELERLRTICDLAKKREHLKKERLVVIQRAFLVHVAAVDPHLAASHPPLPPLVLAPASPAVPPPVKPHSTPSRNDAAADSPAEPPLEDLNLMKQVIEAAITFVGRQSQELPKHDVLVSVLTKKAYKRGVTGLRALGKLYYVAGGNGGGSRYMLTNELTLSQVLSHVQRLIHRSSPSKRGRRSSMSVDDEEGSPKPQKTARKEEPEEEEEEEEAAAVSGEEENGEEEDGEPEEAQSGEAEEEEEEAEEEEEEEPANRRRGRRTAAAQPSPARPSRSRAATPAAPAAAMTSPAAAGGGSVPKKLRQTKLQLVVKKDARAASAP